MLKMNIRRQLDRPIAFFLGCLCWWAAGNANAQFTGGTRGGAGGASRGGSGSTGGTTRDYPNNTTVGDAMVSVDTDGKRIIVVADEDTQLQVGQVIANLDRAKPQVLIKVVFVEVTHSDNLDFGVEGGFSKGIGQDTTASAVNSFGLSGLNAAQSNLTVNQFGLNTGNLQSPGAGLYQILGKDYQVTLRAIQSAGKAEVLSRPSILARSGQPATISVGQQVPLITGTRFDTLGNQINTVTYTSIGIILKVTPFISTNGFVEMIVSPEASELADRSQWIPISSGAGGTITSPVINSRSADTVAVVPDGQTVIIGSIPLLGNLFKHRVKSDNKTELIIFLTPQIIPAPADLAALTASEQARAKGMINGEAEKEMNRLLDTLPVKAPEKDKGTGK
jgi:general secretion pathway protein D